MATYKVSYVIKNSDQTGGILNLEDKPEVGDTIQIGGQALEVKDVFELIPPQEGFHYLHATCVVVDDD